MMRRDPKKADTYRFNGNPHLHSGSIRPVTITDLVVQMRQLEAKLADPEDPDDTKWTERWLNRYEAELAKKLNGRSLKGEERAKATSHRRQRPGREALDD
ncbi:MAG: hypothetical protein ACP5XB_17595 [Isosphaeraceae bacterium]